jgi:serine/threonine protein kinase
VYEALSYYRRLQQRVLSEARAIAALNHPHIVRYYTSWLEVYLIYY